MWLKRGKAFRLSSFDTFDVYNGEAIELAAMAKAALSDVLATKK